MMKFLVENSSVFTPVVSFLSDKTNALLLYGLSLHALKEGFSELRVKKRESVFF